jgi:hypothetical protein
MEKVENDKKCATCEHLPRCIFPRDEAKANFCRSNNYFFYLNLDEWLKLQQR